MALHFSREEFETRRRAVLAAMADAGLDALLMFRQESMYWLTGYDSFGYVYFQSLVLTAAGDLVLLTRAPDLRQARHTSLIADIRIWEDAEDADPARDLRAILVEKGLAGQRLGIEYEAYGLTARNGRRLDAALDGFARTSDASFLVSRLRLVKSPAELAFVRRAAELADDALEAAMARTEGGADEGEILADLQAAILAGGGDLPANPQVIGSGADALLCRTKTGRRRLDAIDQLTLELAGSWRHYHACSMRTLYVGRIDSRQRALHAACEDALAAAEAELVPGRTMGEVYVAQAAVLDRHGLLPHRLFACGYSLGATFQPNWMDWPMFYRGNPVPIMPGMVVFLHMILADSDSVRAATLGRSSIVGTSGPEPLSRLGTEPVLR